jgi:hypothetical protein
VAVFAAAVSAAVAGVVAEAGAAAAASLSEAEVAISATAGAGTSARIDRSSIGVISTHDPNRKIKSGVSVRRTCEGISLPHDRSLRITERPAFIESRRYTVTRRGGLVAAKLDYVEDAALDKAFLSMLFATLGVSSAL